MVPPTRRKSDGYGALDHPRRKAIFEAVQSEPGLNWNQIQKRTGLSVGTLLFHLGKLEEAGTILRRESTNKNEVLFFTPDNVGLWRDPRTRVLFGNESTRRIAEVITREPGRSVQDIAAEVELHPMTVRYHLEKLMEHELLLAERDGARVFYHPTNRLKEKIDTVWEN